MGLNNPVHEHKHLWTIRSGFESFSRKSANAVCPFGFRFGRLDDASPRRRDGRRPRLSLLVAVGRLPCRIPRPNPSKGCLWLPSVPSALFHNADGTLPIVWRDVSTV